MWTPTPRGLWPFRSFQMFITPEDSADSTAGNVPTCLPRRGLNMMDASAKEDGWSSGVKLPRGYNFIHDEGITEL